MSASPKPERPEKKDLSDPTYNLTDFRTQAFGGSLRWLATALALFSIGVSIWFCVLPTEREVFFPFHMKGGTVLWVVGICTVCWLTLAVVNWRNWRKKKRGQA